MGLFSFRQELAMDLGTANTIIIKDDKIVLDEPSVVAFDNRTGEMIAVGTKAREMYEMGNANIRTIRPLREGVIADFDAAEHMIRGMIRMISRRRGWFTPSLRMVVCIPSGSTEVEIRAVRDSSEHAGGRDVYMIYEPMAAAIGVGIDVHCPVAVPMDDRGRACGLAVAWDNDVLSYYFNKYSGRRTERAVAATGNHASQSTFLAVAAAEARGVAGSSGTPRLRRVRRDWPGSSRRSCRPRGRRPREPPGRSSSRCSPRHPSAPTRPPVPGRPAPRAAGRCTDDARLEAHDIGVAAEGIEDLLWIDRGRAFSGERGMPRRGAPDAPGPG